MLSNLIDALRGRKALSSGWQESIHNPTVDLVRHSLCGVRLGEDIQGLSSLGRCHDHRRSWYSLRYPHKGLSFWAELDYVESGTDRDPIESDTLHLETLIIYVKASAPAIQNAFSGDFLVDGQIIDLNAATTPEDAVKLLGEPFARGTELGDEILFYEFELPAGSRWPVCEWQLCFTGGLLVDLELTPYPDLANEASRREYGIEKEWPFALA